MDKDQMVKSCGTMTLAKCHIEKRPNCAHNIYIGICAELTLEYAPPTIITLECAPPKTIIFDILDSDQHFYDKINHITMVAILWLHAVLCGNGGRGLADLF